jgi:hypothetical protein
MGWVRRHNRLGACFAFAALALQIVLSFGHVHLDGAQSTIAHSHRAVGHSITLAKAPAQAPAHNPGTDDDYCAICASIYLASTSLVAQAPPVPVPLRFVLITHVFTAERGLSESRRVAFRSRAPPAALV